MGEPTRRAVRRDSSFLGTVVACVGLRQQGETTRRHSLFLMSAVFLVVRSLRITHYMLVRDHARWGLFSGANRARVFQWPGAWPWATPAIAEYCTTHRPVAHRRTRGGRRTLTPSFRSAADITADQRHLPRPPRGQKSPGWSKVRAGVPPGPLSSRKGHVWIGRDRLFESRRVLR
jgi:hypothetical protein